MSAPRVAAEEWRGLVPLHSTRDDVFRLFGECSNAKGFCEFMLRDEEVHITLSTNERCSERVPLHTVLMIERQLQVGTTLTALGLDKRRFKSFNPWTPQRREYRAYIDEESGLILKSFQGEIFQINYIPPGKERSVCAGYYRKPREFAQVTPEHVPYVFIRCPKSSVVAGDKIAITAYYVATGQRNSLLWLSSAGRIIEGQHTKRIILDTSGIDGPTVTVTVERHDGTYGRMTDSCVLSISPKPKNL